MNDNINTLIANSYTKPQVIKRLSLLHDFLNFWLFGSQQNLEEALTQFQQKNPDSQLTSAFDSTFLNQFNRANVTERLKELSDRLNQFKVLTISLPVDFPEDQINQIGQYLRTNFKTQLLIEIKIDPMLIAGVGLSWSGSYRDYSLKAKIAQNRNAILEDFKKGLH